MLKIRNLNSERINKVASVAGEDGLHTQAVLSVEAMLITLTTTPPRGELGQKLSPLRFNLELVSNKQI